MGGVKTADPLPIAVDLLALDEIADPFEGVDAFAADTEGGIAAVQHLEFLEARLQRGRDLAAVAGRAAPAGVLGIEHRHLAAPARDPDGGGEAGIAPAHDRGIGAG